jgi:hypothetical protein
MGQTLREFIAEEEAKQQATRDREAQARQEQFQQQERELSRNAGKLLKLERARLLGPNPDQHRLVSAALTNVTMTEAGALAYNKKAIADFIKSEPRYTATPENADLIIGYMGRNGIRIFDVEMLSSIFNRIWDAGIFPEQEEQLRREQAYREQQEREAQAAQAQAQLQASEEENLPRVPLYAKRRPGWIKENDPDRYGVDQITGQMRVFTFAEQERMSADEYRKTFCVSAPVSLIEV